MSQRSPIIEFEDVSLHKAQRMSRRPRMNFELYDALKEKIHALGKTAIRLTIPEGTNPTTMKHRILRVAAELNIRVTIRKIPGGLLFGRSTDEDLQQAEEVVQQLQLARKPPRTTRRGTLQGADNAAYEGSATGELES